VRGGAAGPPPDPEVRARGRRTFTAEYKARVLCEADGCTQPGQVGALLRREGLHSSHLALWRGQRTEAERRALAPKKRGPKGRSPEAQRLAQLEQKAARLEEELRKANLIIEYQERVHALLEVPVTHLPDAGRR
jgi:transposase-like protein